MALLAGLTTIRYYTAADPYYYAIDNRPLVDLAASVAFLATSIDTGPIRTGDGSSAVPAYSFVANTGVGLFRDGANLSVTCGGTYSALFGAFGLALGAGALTWATAPNAAGDLILTRDAANILAQRNGVNPQAFRLYNTFTDASNYERVSIKFSSNELIFGPEGAGTGVNNRGLTLHGRDVIFASQALAGQWKFDTNNTGHLLAINDNSYDIGAPGATRPRHIYLGGRYVGAIATVTYSASMTPDAATGNQQTITATNNTAFTINAPSNPASGQKLNFTIRNTSGGALGVATWNAVFKMATWTQPATANNRSITFFYDGTNWVEMTRTTTDIPN